jgi:hypothetical protein
MLICSKLLDVWMFRRLNFNKTSHLDRFEIGLKTWAGGGAGFMARPPGRDCYNLGAPQAPSIGALKTGFSNTRLDLKKNTKDGIVSNFENRKL